MRYKLLACAVLSFSLSVNTQAAPKVAVDIAPMHSLVSQVMEGVNQPSLLIPAEASPHNYILRPSEAKALADAELVFWVGEGLTPWLEKALDNLASSAQKVEVLEIEGTTTYEFREGASFESHDHGDEEGHDDEKHHKDEHHEEEKNAHHEGEKGHADHHDHEGSDPHAWLDPANAKIWINYISDTLSKRDPENASIYKRNAAKATASLDTLMQSTRTQIKALGEPQFIVFHDAYQYFEKRFGISAAGSISLGDAEAPSPARIREIQQTVKKLGVTCVFTEPQYNSGLVKNVFEGTSVSTIGVMDPLGADISTGSGHYQALIMKMVKSLSECQ